MLSQLGFLALCLLGLSQAIPAEKRQSSSVQIFPQISMTDTDGNAIQAHGGDIIQDNGYFYWFGEDKTGETTSGHFIGVNCYRSTDFASWEYRGAVLSPQSGTDISSESVVERPKVLYNEANDEYVMWFHNDDSSYGAAMVGVATSSTIDGTYTWLGSFQPFDTDSRDMTVWKDDDGTAYLIFASDGNADFKIASLTDDYHDVSEMVYEWTGVYWEAPGVFKIDGTYYLLYSKQDGWTPTDNYYMKATSMAGSWSDSVLLAPTGYYAYNTQNAYDITITGSQGTIYLYYGDHWNSGSLGSSTYAFYPVTYSSGSISLSYSSGYTLSTSLGTWSNLTSDTYDTSSFTYTGGATTQACSQCTSGSTISLSAGGTISFTYNGSAGEKVLSIRYVYQGGKQVWESMAVKVDGTTAATASLESTRGVQPYFDAPVRATLKSGSTVTLDLSAGTGDTGVLRVASVEIYDVE